MPMNGIDISSWQTGINLHQVPCDFAIIKATGGTGYVNPDCDRAFQQGQKAGKKLGIYHYAREKGCKGSAQDEADFFVKNITGYIGKAILVLDWEEENELGTEWVKSWLDRVQLKTGVKPLIYMSKSVCREYDWSSVASAGYDLWCAQYANNNETGYQSSPWTDANGIGAFPYMALYQYTASGRLNGWNGRLDLNVFYGDKTAWDKYARAGSTETDEPKKPEKDAPEKGSVVLAENTGAENQRWKLEKAGGYYRLIQKSSGKVLDIQGQADKIWSKIIVSEENGSASQLWKLLKTNNETADYVEFEPANGVGYRLDVADNATVPGSYLQIYEKNDTSAQRFYLRKERDGYYIIFHTFSLLAVAA